MAAWLAAYNFKSHPHQQNESFFLAAVHESSGTASCRSHSGYWQLSKPLSWEGAWGHRPGSHAPFWSCSEVGDSQVSQTENWGDIASCVRYFLLVPSDDVRSRLFSSWFGSQEADLHGVLQWVPYPLASMWIFPVEDMSRRSEGLEEDEVRVLIQRPLPSQVAASWLHIHLLRLVSSLIQISALVMLKSFFSWPRGGNGSPFLLDSLNPARTFVLNRCQMHLRWTFSWNPDGHIHRR